MKEIIWQGWHFTLGEAEPIFGKLQVVAARDEIEEVFYVYGEELTEEICEDLYDKYLYAYQ